MHAYQQWIVRNNFNISYKNGSNNSENNKLIEIETEVIQVIKLVHVNGQLLGVDMNSL